MFRKIVAALAAFVMVCPAFAGPQWADVAVGPDTRVVFVDASRGVDSNDGLSLRTPVRTLPRGYGLLRDRWPDHLALSGTFVGQRIGEEGNPTGGGFKKSGRSLAEPMVIRSVDGERAAIHAGGVYPSILGWAEDGRAPSFVVVSGVDFIAHTRIVGSPAFDPTDFAGEAVRFVGSGFTGWTFQDVLVHGFAGGFALESDTAARPHTHIRIVGARVLDSYGGWQPGPGLGTRGHSSGLYARNVDGLVIEWSVFDRNGWAPDAPELIPGAPKTTYNHGLYLHGSCRNVIVRHNFITRSSFAGVQARGGSMEVIDNLLTDNPAHIGAGHAQTSWPANAWTGTIARNVVIGGADIGPDQRRGWGVGASHSDGGSITGNIVALNLTAGGGPGISVGSPLRSLVVERNIVYRWRGDQLDGGNAFLLEAPVTGDLIVQENDFQQIRGGLAYIFAPDFGGATLIRNRWFTTSASTQVVRRFQRSSVPFEQIGSIAVADEQTFEEVPYPDPERTPQRYAREVLGLDGNWLDAVRGMTRATWNDRMTATAFNEWIRAGFGITPASNDQ